jgi:carbamoyltransferase
MQSVMNLKTKFRESFRPFAPMVLQEHVHEYFQLRPGTQSPYMMVVAPVHEQIRVPATGDQNAAFGVEKLRYPRSQIPAVTHVDDSARVQTIDAERNPLTYQLLTQFKEKTGCPVLINTSFNVRGEPIVCTPEDAYRCFMRTDIDVLVMGHHVLKKHEQKNPVSMQERSQYLSEFMPD